ncbi:MAG: TIGR03667 family PPOX class F420-dependent oxidoreductase [Chloroflexota bacterium]|nr:TIGR03667 family PPOX class F420-dependent oxidoreductase [Chloroflexota bacterium]
MPLIDTSTEFGQRVERHLANEQVIWLTTVRADGTPQPSPVWFLREGDTLLIYSQPKKPKVRNIRANPKVALSFNSTPSGGDVVVFTGEASLDGAGPAAVDHPEYMDKYREGILGLNSTPERFSAEYSVPIRVRLTELRGF